MDDDEMFSLLEQQEEQEDEAYQYGLRLWHKERDKNPDNVDPKIVEHCPWCHKKSYEFWLLSGFSCNECDYSPGADLFGGRFS